jgi:hypothetical protein
MLGAPSVASAQPPAPATVSTPEQVDVRWVTVRLHAGPNLNMMSDWRNGFDTLQTRARQQGLPITGESAIVMSWGATAIVHVAPRVGVGVQFEMLRDTRSFTVEDSLWPFAAIGSFGYTTEAVVRTTQGVVALYPRDGSRMHVQFGAGRGSGHSQFSSPGSEATGRGSAMLVSASVGMESKIWYVDSGWRFHKVHVTYDAFRDVTIGQRRDLFLGEAELQGFVEPRDADFTGGWVRIGLVFRFGRK